MPQGLHWTLERPTEKRLSPQLWRKKIFQAGVRFYQAGGANSLSVTLESPKLTEEISVTSWG